MDDALGIRRNSKADGVVFVCLTHLSGGHNQSPVSAERAGLVYLGAPDNDAIAIPVYHAQVQVRVFLL